MELSRIPARLRSEQGASLIFGLFFFVVCAVVGSVVLTAGTAAAGRLSRAIQMDQRYFSVNSAAEMLEHEMDLKDAWVKRTITLEREDVIKTKLKKKKSDGTWEEAGEPKRETGKTYDANSAVDPDTGLKKEVDLSTGTPLYQGTPTPTPVEAITTNGSKPIATLLKAAVDQEYGDTRNVELHYIDSENTEVPDLNTVALVTRKPKENPASVREEYNLSIVLRDTIGDNEKQRYYLTLDCPAHVLKKTDVQEQTTEVTIIEEDGRPVRKETRKVTTTLTDTINWSVAATMKGTEAWVDE